MLDDFDDAEPGSSDADTSEKILIIHRENEADHADFSFDFTIS